MGNMMLFASYVPGQGDFVGMLLALLVLTFCYGFMTKAKQFAQTQKQRMPKPTKR